jgi:predicted Rossmann fold nucleotide-binding protein DprA/Smf involved in DNA uptake
MAVCLFNSVQINWGFLMNNTKLTEAFATALGSPTDQIVKGLAYGQIKQWDSTAHMILIAELENVFEVMLDTDDIIDMSSYQKAQEILTRYGIRF